ncbi:hypothetical protein [Thalassospira sp.]|uniref:hypothetical protein n=1 Tax=Thalassospira sp. TaxID=1912094 RepID=UPI0032EB0BF3
MMMKIGRAFALATPSPTRFPIFGEMGRFDKKILMGSVSSWFAGLSPNWFAEIML